mmetsp:Transcript_83682/g.241650  ORF Transcript_83682/g.241650 Transcript_83682/m.241650 type:complete len:592 (+) Transcript_83682:111-1886(+)
MRCACGGTLQKSGADSLSVRDRPRARLEQPTKKARSPSNSGPTCHSAPVAPLADNVIGPAHHVQELIEFNAAVPVLVGAFQNLGDRFRRDALDMKYIAEFRQGDLAVTVLIEDIESCPQDFVGQVRFPVKRGRHEFRVIDRPRLVDVHVGDHRIQVGGAQLQAGPFEANLQFHRRQLSVPIGVKRLEGLAQLLQLGFGKLAGDDLHRGVFEMVLGLEAAEPFDEFRAELCLRGARRRMLHPVVVQRLVGGHPCLRVHLHHRTDKVLRLRAYVVPSGLEFPASLPHLGERLLICPARDGRPAAQQDVHYDADTPDVALLVVPAHEHLRRHVDGCAEFRLQHLPRFAGARQAEIDELQNVALGVDWMAAREQKVLRLDVAVRNIVVMHVIHSTENLPHDVGGIDFAEVLSLDDAVEQFAAAAQLHREMDRFPVLEHFEELDDVRMVNFPHSRDLVVQRLGVLRLASFVDRLDRPRDAGGLVSAHSDAPKGALPELICQFVHVRDVTRVLEDDPANGTSLRPRVLPRGQQRRRRTAPPASAAHASGGFDRRGDYANAVASLAKRSPHKTGSSGPAANLMRLHGLDAEVENRLRV